MTSPLNAAHQDFAAKTHAAAVGLEDAIADIPGLLASMLVVFGRNGIRTVEDLAACATDDLLGWTERRETRSPIIPASSATLSYPANNAMPSSCTHAFAPAGSRQRR